MKIKNTVIFLIITFKTFSQTVGIGSSSFTPGSTLSVDGNVSIGNSYRATSTGITNGLVVEGNVGIGTTTVGSKLTVAGGAYFGTAGNNGSGFSIHFSGSNAKTSSTSNPLLLLSSSDALASNPLIMALTVTGNATAGSRYGAIEVGEFGTGNYRNLILQPNGGNVGIGTTISGSLLHLHSTTNGAYEPELRLVNTNVGSDPGIKLYHTTNDGYRIRLGGGASDNLYFSTTTDDASFTDQVIFTGTGNVGIGTSTIGATLHVKKDADAQNGMIVENASAGTAAGAMIEIRNSTSLNEALRLETLGSAFTTTGGFIQDGAAISAETNLSGGLSLITRAAAPITFWTGGHTNERMRIDANGNVGIGTTPSSFKMQVNGAILGQGLVDTYANAPATAANANFLNYYVSATNWAGMGNYTNGAKWFRSGEYLFWTNGVVGTPTVAARINGGDVITSGGVSLAGLSDVRYKKDIKRLENCLDKVCRLNGVSYDWNDNFPQKEILTGRQTGVIAQEVEAQFPDLVYTDPAGYKSVNYMRLTPILIEAIKEQQQQLEKLQMGLEQKEQANTSLENEVKELSRKVETLLNAQSHR